MHLKSGIVAIIFAAAAGAAAGRATAPHATVATAQTRTAKAPADIEIATNVDGPQGGAMLRNEGGFASGSAIGRGRIRNAAPGTGQAVVYVAGAVVRPGVYSVRVTARADDALRAAGGATGAADLVAINLAARVEDGEEIAVPLRGAEAAGAGGATSQTKKHKRRAGKRGHRHKRFRQSDDSSATVDTSTTDAPSEMVDVNGADEGTLETLPGVGPSLARRIVAFRDLNGPFASTDELLDVGGMTAGKVDAISPYLTFH